MWISMYKDKLVDIGYMNAKEWDADSYIKDNTCAIDVPEEILKAYYRDRVAKWLFGKPFSEWYSQLSIADDMDELFDYTEWRPFLADVDPNSFSDEWWRCEL